MPIAMNEAKINNNSKQLSLRDIANIISIAFIFSSFSVLNDTYDEFCLVLLETLHQLHKRFRFFLFLFYDHIYLLYHQYKTNSKETARKFCIFFCIFFPQHERDYIETEHHMTTLKFLLDYMCC